MAACRNKWERGLMKNSMGVYCVMKTLIQRLTTYSLNTGMGWVLVMMLLTTFDVAGRYFFSKPVLGSIELSKFMLAVFGILGMAYTHSTGSNVRVTMLTQILPGRFAAFVKTLTDFLSLQIFAVLSWYSMVMGIDELHMHTTTDTLGIPVFPLYFLLASGSLFLSLEIIINLIESIRGMFSVKTDRNFT